MEFRQRFFSTQDYKPNIWGYVRGEIVDGFRYDITAYRELRGIEGVRQPIKREPYSKKSMELPFRSRPMGSELVKSLRPSDHLIVHNLDQLSSVPVDLLAIFRWTYEQGIRLHFVEFMGTPLDCWSHPGRLVLASVCMKLELDIALSEERKRLAPKPRRRHYQGMNVPWYCDATEDSLQVNPQALELIRKAVQWRDELGLTFGQIARRMDEEWELTTGRALFRFRGRTTDGLDSYAFYKGWEAAGFPPLTKYAPHKLRRAWMAACGYERTRSAEVSAAVPADLVRARVRETLEAGAEEVQAPTQSSPQEAEVPRPEERSQTAVEQPLEHGPGREQPRPDSDCLEGAKQST